MNWFNNIKTALVALFATTFNIEMSEAEVHQSLLDLNANGGFVSKKEFDEQAKNNADELAKVQAQVDEAKKSNNSEELTKQFAELKQSNEELTKQFAELKQSNDTLKTSSAEEINNLKTKLATAGKGGANNDDLEGSKRKQTGTVIKAGFLDDFLSKGTTKY